MSKTLEVRKSRIFGRGCFTLVRRERRRKIAEYAGELIRGRRNIQARLDEQKEIKIIWLGNTIAIDGAAGGDETAFINHSCEPNAFMRIAPGNRIIFFALRDIESGEEITIDYRDETHPPPEPCRCGASKCRSLKVRTKR